MACDLVMIEWLDSSQPLPGWRYLSDMPPAEVVSCVSVGWLLGDGDEVKVLAPNMGNLDDEDAMQASGIIRIPACCVKRVAKLVETS